MQIVFSVDFFFFFFSAILYSKQSSTKKKVENEEAFKDAASFVSFCCNNVSIEILNSSVFLSNGRK